MSTMKFCCECNNILYPKEDREQKILLYACRNCNHQMMNRGRTLMICQKTPIGSSTSLFEALADSQLASTPCLKEVADNNCVYRNVIHHSVDEFAQVLHDVTADPTLPHTKSVRCGLCNHQEAVFFQATTGGEEGMTLFFVCCNPSCGHRWRD